MYGMTKENIMEDGRTIKWMDLEYSCGQTRENTKVNTKMIKRKDMELLFGLMIEDTKGTGLMESNMEKVSFIIPRTEFGKEESGMTVKE